MKLEDIEKYKEELEAGIKKCMSNPVCERSTNAIDSMVLCWQHITDMENMIKKQFELTPEKAEEWLLNMKNEDGTKRRNEMRAAPPARPWGPLVSCELQRDRWPCLRSPG